MTEHSPNVQPLTLEPGTRIDRFTIEAVIAVRPSGITYRAAEIGTSSRFVLREYWPAGSFTRSADGAIQAANEADAINLAVGSAQFLAGATALAAFDHPALGRVTRWFKANGTAYLVLPWPEGRTLAALLEDRQVLDANETALLAKPLLDGLDYLHGQGHVQLELAPDLIQVLDGGEAALLGTGALLQSGVAADESLDDSYAAIEQIQGNSPIGPWTDIYRLAACFYLCLGGKAPPSAQARRAALQSGLPDPLVPIELPPAARPALREMATLIERGLALEASARPKTVREWRARVAHSPDVSQTTEPVSGKTPPAEGREWLPTILLIVFLAGVLIISWYLYTHRESTVETTSASGAAASSAEETERWRQALEANAVLTYREFIEEFPQSKHLQEAKEQIDILEDKAWEGIVAEDTKAAYEAHLDMFPQGRHVSEARARIEEFRLEEERLVRQQQELKRQDDAAWNSARSLGTLAALDGYITEWPTGLHAAEAHELRQGMQGGINDDADFRIASGKNTIEAYRTYISSYPAGRHVAAAQQAIDRLTLRVGKTFQDCTECPMMVVIPAGAFWQGSPDTSVLAISIEKPRFRVTIAEAFAMSAHEITMAEWDACAADGGCQTHPPDNGWGRGSRPVIMVSWVDAGQYTTWLSKKTGQVYSLPSESQWEYAARAGEESDWPGGDPAGICAFGNIAGGETGFEWRHKACADNSELGTMPVGSYRANAFGLYDVIGNVAEWTLDCMNLSYLDAPADGSAWTRGMCSSHMTRGGSWFTGAKESRLPARFNLKNGDRNDFTGFRVVRRVEKL